MSEHRITYDSSDVKSQWRCQLRPFMQPFILVAWIGLTVVYIAVLKPSVLMTLFLLLGPPLIVIGSIANVTNKRCRGPRICTTSINESGVTDVTPDSDRTLPWQKVVKVEIESGDVYFHGFTASVYVPSLAFPNPEAARKFFNQAYSFWQAARGTSVVQLPGDVADLVTLSTGSLPVERASKQEEPLVSQSVVASDQEIIDEYDESVWREIEKAASKTAPANEETEDKNGSK